MTADMYEIREGTAADVDRLEELWVAVHHTHMDAMPELAPYVSDARTWELLREHYVHLFERPDTLLALAFVGEELAGYTIGAIHPVQGSWVPDTWETGPRYGEVESIGVAPAHRGAGIGGALLDRLDAHFAQHGVEDVVIGALAGNAAAIRLYERRGFRPTWLYLSRFKGRA
jgi:ribosomal protein S18 acetylase RimI-like enzyme